MSHVTLVSRKAVELVVVPDILENMTLTSDTELTDRIRHMVYDEHFEPKSP